MIRLHLILSYIVSYPHILSYGNLDLCLVLCMLPPLMSCSLAPISIVMSCTVHSPMDSLALPSYILVYIVCNPAPRGSPFELSLGLCSSLPSPTPPFPLRLLCVVVYPWYFALGCLIVDLLLCYWTPFGDYFSCFPFQICHMTCGCCVFLFPFVCLVCILKIFVPIVSSLQSLTLGTRVLNCGLFEQGHDWPLLL